MNNSTLSLEEQSLANLKTQFPLNIVIFDVLAPLTIISNLAVAFVIIRGGKSFRSNHYILLYHTTMVATAQAFNTFVMNGIFRVANTVNRIPDNGTVLRCSLIHLISELTVLVDQYNILVLAMDRLLAIVVPFKYKTLSSSKIYLATIMAATWTLSITITVAKFPLYTLSFSLKTLPVCVISNTRTPEYADFRYYHGILVVGATMALYIAALVIVKYKISNTGNTQQLKKEIGYRFIITSAVDGINFSATYFVSQVYLNLVTTRVSPQDRTMLTPLAFGFILLSSTPRFLINYCCNKEFRNTVKKFTSKTVPSTTLSTGYESAKM